MGQRTAGDGDGVKHLTAENWLTPDQTGRAFVEINPATGARRPASAEEWARRYLAVDLADSVPADVRDMWEVARGVLLYGWFYYPLYEIGENQLRRVADTAVLHRYQQAGGPAQGFSEGEPTWPTFKRRVEWLLDKKIIREEVRGRWEAIRELRNEASHASRRYLTTPIDGERVLEMLATEIDALFTD
jgi:Domain of unknown function (DUF4145)